MKNKIKNYAALVMGILFFVSSLLGFLYTDKPVWVLAVGIGIGAMAFSTAISRILTNYSLKDDKELQKKHEISNNDERKQFILGKASYRVYQLMTPILGILGFSLGLLGVETWIICIPVGIFVLEGVLMIVLHAKYNKEY